jgi:hypothetical protein
VSTVAAVLSPGPTESATIASGSHQRSDRDGGLARRGHKGEGGGPPDGVLGHLDAIYALALLSSGDGDDAERVVVDAFRALICSSAGKTVGDSSAWRMLGDYVRLAGEEAGLSPATLRAPFRQGALSQNQSEAIALVLGGRGAPEAAGMLGVSLLCFERELRSGLEMLHAVMRANASSCASDCSDSWRNMALDTSSRCSSGGVVAR